MLREPQHDKAQFVTLRLTKGDYTLIFTKSENCVCNLQFT